MSKATTIRAAVQAAAEKNELTAYAIAKAVNALPRRKGKPLAIWTVQRYLNGEADMTSEKLDAVFQVLGLSIR